MGFLTLRHTNKSNLHKAIHLFYMYVIPVCLKFYPTFTAYLVQKVERIQYRIQLSVISAGRLFVHPISVTDKYPK